MNCFQANNVRHPSRQTSRQPALSVPILAALCLLCLQKGCIWNPDISPAHAVWDTNRAVVSGQKPLTSEAEEVDSTRNYPIILRPVALPDTDQALINPSLRQASGLLRQAATLLEQNDRAAIRLILQAITILKQEIMQDVQGSEYDRISLSPFPSEHDALRQNISTISSSLRHECSLQPPALQCDNQSAIPISEHAGRVAEQDRRGTHVE